MLLKKGLQLSSYDQNRFVITTKSNRHYVVNQKVSKLYRVLDNSKGWDDANQKFQEEYSVDFNIEDFRAIVYKVLGGKDILQGEMSLPDKEKKFLRLRQQVIPAHIAEKIVTPFTFLFDRASFSWLFVTLVVINAATIIYGNLALITSSYISQFTVWLFPLVFASTVIHEFGHITACRAYDAPHGGIGFGFYLIFPVNYSDVDGVWTLGKDKRIIVNLAGVYFELLYIMALLVTFIIVQNSLFLLAASVVILNAARQLYPFFRLDGYWVLSDWIGIPNLIDNSRTQIMREMKGITSILNKNGLDNQTSVFNWNKKNIFLLLYGLTNNMITVFFIGMVLINYHKEMLQFPVLFLELVRNLFMAQWDQASPSFEFLVVAAFYVMAIKFVFQNVSRWFRESFRKHGNREHAF